MEGAEGATEAQNAHVSKCGGRYGVSRMKHERIQNRLYSLPEAAEYLGRSEWGIRRLIWVGWETPAG